MTIARGVPYLYVTWIPRYLTGEKSCLWAASRLSSRHRLRWLSSSIPLIVVIPPRAKHQRIMLDNPEVLVLDLACGGVHVLVGHPDPSSMALKPRPQASLRGALPTPRRCSG